MILGTIGAYSAGQGVTLTIDGEETPTQKEYKFLASYTPTAGDRVLIEEIADSYVVLGKLADTASGGGGGDISNLGLSYNAAANPSANDAMYLKNGSANLSYARIDSVRKAMSIMNYGGVGYIWIRKTSSNTLQWAFANDGSYPQTWRDV